MRWWLCRTVLVVCVALVARPARGQTATYHLHNEASTVNSINKQLKTANPDNAAVAVQGPDLKNSSTNANFPIKSFETQAGVPNAGGTIPAGATATFSLWMRKTANWGTMQPFIVLYKNNYAGAESAFICGIGAYLGTTPNLTTTLTKYTFNCTTPNAVTMTITDRFYLQVGVWLTVSPGSHSVRAEVHVEGTPGGNYDSTVVAPLPPPPTIASVTPSRGPTGTPVQIQGTNFGATQGTSTVTFNTVTAPVVSWSNTTLDVTVPAAATSGPVTVTVAGTPNTCSGPCPTFTVTPAPSITNIAPNPAVPGQSVTITGQYFLDAQGPNTVTFNGVAGAPTAWTDTTITAPVPSTATTGPVIVTVYGNASNQPTLTIITTGTVSGTITRASDGSALAGATVQAVLTGEVVSSVTSAANGTYSIPDLEQGTYDVRVLASGYASEVRSGTVVTPNATTTVNVAMAVPGSLSGVVTQSDGVTPIAGAAVAAFDGPVQKGVTQTDGAGAYALPGLRPAAYAVRAAAAGYSTKVQTATVNENANTVSDFALQTAPAGPVTYVYDETNRLVSVVDPSGEAAHYTYDAVGNILSISRTSASGVSVGEFTPNSGPTGTTVTIYGTGFGTTPASNAVTFNGATATVTTATPTQLTAVVPAGATTGVIGVTSPNGSAASQASFVVAASSGPPSVAGFTPQIAVVGTPVSITGSNFETVLQNNRVTFNTTFAHVSSGTTSTLSTAVPTTATSGRLTVATPAGTATGPVDFFVPPAPYTAADVLVADRMAIGGSRLVEMPTAQKIALIVFDATAGQRVTAQISAVTIASSTFKIFDPFGGVVKSLTVGTSGAFIDAVQLPATGTYTILVAPSGTNTGNLTITLNAIVDVTGPITPDGTPVSVPIATPGQNGRLTFTGAAGQKVSASITLTSGGSFSCSWYLKILNPDGTALGSTSVCSGTTLFLDTQTLAGAGTYTVLVDPNGTQTGTVDARLYGVTDITGSIGTNGTAVNVPITVPGQNGRLTFSGTAGQTVSASITRTSGTFSCSWYLKILNPDNTILASTSACSGTLLFLDSQTLPATGTYTLLVDPSGALTGTVDARAYVVSDVIGSITADGTPVTVPITGPGQNGRLTFSGTAGQKVSASMTLTSGGAFSCYWYLKILNPDNSVLGSVWACSGTVLFLDVQTLPTTGTYTLLVDPDGALTGTVDARLYSVTDVTGTIAANSTPVSVPIATPGQNGRLTFSGTAAQKVSATITRTSGGSFSCYWYLKILNPDNSVLASVWACSGTVAFLDTVTLPSTGTYTLLVDPDGMLTGTVDAQVNTVTDVTGPIAVNGAAVSVPLVTPGQNGRLTFTGSASQVVSVSITRTSGGTFSCFWYLKILKPDSTVLGSVWACSGTVLSLNSQTLPTAGTYTVLIDPDGMQTGTVSTTLISP